MEHSSWLRPPGWERLQLATLAPRDVLLYLTCRSFRSFMWGFERLPTRYLAWTSRVRALSFFGPGYPYLILGYPPFVKQLIDVAEARNFPLHEYRLNALVGGEGMSEDLRDYLLRRFQKVYSGYGATDLEIGLAGETPLSVALRRLTRA
jgi:hypothetical protein